MQNTNEDYSLAEKLCRQMSRGWEGTKHKLDKRYDKSNEQI